MPKSQAVNWESVEKDLVSIVGSELVTLLEGAAVDVQKYAVEIAGSLAVRMASGEANVTKELIGQLKLVAEANRIRANEAGWNAFERILNVAMRTAQSLLAAALGGLPGAAVEADGGK